jgi:hypothetical protein
MNDETGWITQGRQMSKKELASMARSHHRPGMTEDKWISLAILGFSLLFLGLALLVVK